MAIDNRLIGAARLAVRIATLGNWLFLVAAAAALLLSLVFPAAFAALSPGRCPATTSPRRPPACGC
ncbi:hypothetical protein [Sandarakinorhabdus sp. DWP1-3-1]|uniref:hypothetical protein n=1 Tax=Sandarakinorhabdus sp. DWP1-3-1 TaxID=2804627 RepID=UPI003CF85AF2